MRVIELRSGYGVDSLTLTERPDPVPGPGQIFLELRALSLNYRDLLVVEGAGRWRPPLPRIPVSDPVVDKVFPFTDAAEAFRYLARGAHFGKVCVRF